MPNRLIHIASPEVAMDWLSRLFEMTPVRGRLERNPVPRRARRLCDAPARTIVRGLAPHQRDEACELCGRLLLSGMSAGMHDQARRQVAAQQTVVRRRDREVSAQQVDPLVRTEILADREVEGALRQARVSL
jgi:hypothetical protein